MTPTPRYEDYRRRSRARRRALQALYQWQVAGQDIASIEKQFLEDYRMGRTDLEYFSVLLHGVPASASRLDAALEGHLDRPFRTLDPVEKAILRLGAYELLERMEVPYRVVLNEAVELAKAFGAEQSHRFINGVLDRVGHDSALRRAELGAGEG
ncbi:transcription antitermination factor NusB [Arhodomonas aquaeolei]|uniref:transcription antitermination factor NusB n=1 Tax=Arhodomonas TaxID=2368 RepID=UPI000380CAFE|nr:MULTISPECIES: transcription antitermination factor NusB [Arhodomonas]MCS4503382.1 transcription antitermination factor NusB [Arhodomonas aquaeolei]